MKGKLKKFLEGIDLEKGLTADDLEIIWEFYDPNKSGSLSKENAEQFFRDYIQVKSLKRKNLKEEQIVNEFFQLYDKNHDDKLSAGELMATPLKPSLLLEGKLLHLQGIRQSTKKEKSCSVRDLGGGVFEMELRLAKEKHVIDLKSDVQLSAYVSKHGNFKFQLQADGQEWLFQTTTKEEQLQWCLVLQKAVIAAVPQSPEAKEIYKEVYRLNGLGDTLKAHLGVTGRKYTGNGMTFVNQKLLEDLDLDVTMLEGCMDSIRTDFPEKSQPWWNQAFLPPYEKLCQEGRLVLTTLRGKLVSHELIGAYFKSYRQALAALHEGDTALGKKDWQTAVIHADSLLKSGQEATDETKIFEKEVARHTEEVTGLLALAAERDRAFRMWRQSLPLTVVCKNLTRSLVHGSVKFDRAPPNPDSHITQDTLNDLSYWCEITKAELSSFTESLSEDEQMAFGTLISTTGEKIAKGSSSLTEGQSRARVHGLSPLIHRSMLTVYQLSSLGKVDAAKKEWSRIIDAVSPYRSEKQDLGFGLDYNTDILTLKGWIRDLETEVNSLFAFAANLETNEAEEITSTAKHYLTWLDRALVLQERKLSATGAGEGGEFGAAWKWQLIQPWEYYLLQFSTLHLERALAITMEKYPNSRAVKELSKTALSKLDLAKRLAPSLQLRERFLSHVRSFISVAGQVEKCLSLWGTQREAVEVALSMWTDAVQTIMAICDSPTILSHARDEVNLFQTVFKKRSSYFDQIFANVNGSTTSSTALKNNQPTINILSPSASSSFSPSVSRVTNASVSARPTGGGHSTDNPFAGTSSSAAQQHNPFITPTATSALAAPSAISLLSPSVNPFISPSASSAQSVSVTNPFSTSSAVVSPAPSPNLLRAGSSSGSGSNANPFDAPSSSANSSLKPISTAAAKPNPFDAPSTSPQAPPSPQSAGPMSSNPFDNSGGLGGSGKSHLSVGSHNVSSSLDSLSHGANNSSGAMRHTVSAANPFDTRPVSTSQAVPVAAAAAPASSVLSPSSSSADGAGASAVGVTAKSPSVSLASHSPTSSGLSSNPFDGSPPNNKSAANPFDITPKPASNPFDTSTKPVTANPFDSVKPTISSNPANPFSPPNESTSNPFGGGPRKSAAAPASSNNPFG